MQLEWFGYIKKEALRVFHTVECITLWVENQPVSVVFSEFSERAFQKADQVSRVRLQRALFTPQGLFSYLSGDDFYSQSCPFSFFVS